VARFGDRLTNLRGRVAFKLTATPLGRSSSSRWIRRSSVLWRVFGVCGLAHPQAGAREMKGDYGAFR